MLPAGATVCPDCGAPIVTHPAGDDSTDQAIYPELARANLLRMRGDYKQAEQVCIGILRKHPNNATANTLLGDICAERGDLDQARQWYELAIDLNPNSTVEKDKLMKVKQRMKEREAVATALHLGLKSRKPVGLWIAIGGLALVVSIASAAYVLGRQNPPKPVAQTDQKTVSMPINVGRETQENPAAGQETVPKVEETPVQQTPAGMSELAKALMTKSAEGGNIKDAWQDPRTKHIFLTFTYAEGADQKKIATSLAVACLDHSPDCPKVRLRGQKNGLDAYLVDVAREDLTPTQSADWQKEHANDPLALQNAILKNEWPVAAPAPSNETPAPTAP